ncbi:hypothetical protein AMELA_G00204790 [Ameiurus melas]|uniref:Uncharacterized protein n=1 Tax=Ameiurus melas TaxID=219545 RepID=A0A7J6A2R5_AMEME|nr:hypothetical protein AMELA_G00204790 [Ameiurus melas]
MSSSAAEELLTASRGRKYRPERKGGESSSSVPGYRGEYRVRGRARSAGSPRLFFFLFSFHRLHRVYLWLFWMDPTITSGSIKEDVELYVLN